jgi:hypothetical protein
MNLRAPAFAVFAATFLAASLSVVACDRLPWAPKKPDEAASQQAKPPAQAASGPQRPEGTVPVEVESEIDWPAARQDASGEAGIAVAVTSPIPILAPSTATAQSFDPAQKNFGVTADGYYAKFPGPRFDMIVNGTKTGILAPRSAPLPREPIKDFSFNYSETGAEVAFNRYGASYLVTFECKNNVVPEQCITEEQARAAIEEFILVGSS